MLDFSSMTHYLKDLTTDVFFFVIAADEITMRCMILAFLLLFVSGSGSLTRIILFRVGGEI